MVQRLKLLKDVLSVFLNRRHGLALLERVHASNLSVEDRALVRRILRAMLRLSEDRGHEVSESDAPAARDGQRDTAHCARVACYEPPKLFPLLGRVPGGGSRPGPRGPSGGVHQPMETLPLSAADGEALIARVYQSNLSAADARVVEQVVRMLLWVV